MAKISKNGKMKQQSVSKKAKKRPSSPAVIRSPYLDKKDKKAAAFLKKHPFPEEFLK